MNSWIAALMGCVLGVAVTLLPMMLMDTSTADIQTLTDDLEREEINSEKAAEVLLATQRERDGYKSELGALEGRPTDRKVGRRERHLETRLVTAREEAKRLQEKLDALVNSPSNSTNGALKRIESTVSSAANWSKLDDEEGRRIYGHTTGLRVNFWEVDNGPAMMRFAWDTSDKQEADMAALMWVLIQGIGGNTSVAYDENERRIETWLGDPKEILLLKGGVIHAKVTGTDAVLDLYCPQ